MKQLYVWGPIIILLILGVLFVPVDFRADVYSLLPKQSATVEALKRYQQAFGSSHTFMVVVSSSDPASTLADAKQVAALIQQHDLSPQVVWQTPFREDTPALGEFLAYLWINQSDNEFEHLCHRLSVEELPNQLSEALERMATSFNAEEVGRLAYDPLGLLTVMDPIDEQAGGDSFVSQDGEFRIIHALCPGESPGFWEYRTWLHEIQTLVLQAQAEGLLSSGCTVRYTGNPAFVVEFGLRMIRDLSFAALSTLLLVMILFWWAHRRWRPMVWMSFLLAVVLILTVLAGTWYFGFLNVISLGFAAILMGLAADYGLIVYQEYRTHPHYTTLKLCRELSPSIVWAAVTTAGAFFMVSRSSLPGLTQLGTLVAIGILTAAVLVLTAFSVSVRATVQGEESDKQVHAERTSSKWPVWRMTLLVFIIGGGVFVWRPPQIHTDVKELEFQNIQSKLVYDEIQSRIQAKVGGSENDLYVITDGKNEADVWERLQRVKSLVSTARAEGLDLKAKLPDALWPNPRAQHSNHHRLDQLLRQHGIIKEQLIESGFDSEAWVLMDAVFDAWEKFSTRIGHSMQSTKILWPTSSGAQWLFGQFANHTTQGWLGLGLITTDASELTPALREFAQHVNKLEGVQIASWGLLADSLAVTMLDDSRKILLPLVIVLMLLLGLAFRDIRDMGLSLLTLIVTLVCLNVFMVILGWSWNIMNMTALPLLLGAGVDYSIHIQLALKRHQGNKAEVYRSVGRAIGLCGASTAAAFASLGFASNPGMASLGRVAALGIVIACATALILLPGWWKSLHQSNLGRS